MGPEAEDMASALRAARPDLRVTTSAHLSEVTKLSIRVAQILMALGGFLALLQFLGIDISGGMTFLGYSMGISLLLSGLVLQQLLGMFSASGAFEVTVNGVPIFSKLALGRMPNDANEVIALLPKAGE